MQMLSANVRIPASFFTNCLSAHCTGHAICLTSVFHKVV